MNRGRRLKNKFIVLEGLDGSGKTSIGQFLAKEYGFKFIKTPDENFEKIRDYVDKQDAYTKLMFYYASCFAVNNKIKEGLKERTIVCDRYFYSTLVYYTYMNDKRIEDTITLMENITEKLMQPDAIIYLQISDDIRANRLQQREAITSSTDTYLLSKMSRCSEMEKMYFNLMDIMSEKIPYIIINAESAVESTCKDIINKIDLLD